MSASHPTGSGVGDDDGHPPERGGAFYDDRRVLDDYLAHRHRAVRSPNLAMEEPAFLRAAGDLRGSRILDLGCGDGSFGELAIEQGCASYSGLDGSALMVEHARERLRTAIDGGTVRILHADLEDLENLEDLEDLDNVEHLGGRDEPGAGDRERPEDPNRLRGPFDLIASRMVLHYVADPAPVLRAVAALLAPGGRFVVSVVHPVISASANPAREETEGPRAAWTVDDYFSPGPRHRDWFGSTVTWHHRTIEDHLVALSDAGLRLLSLSEAAPDPDRFDGDLAEYHRRARVPLFLVLATTTF